MSDPVSGYVGSRASTGIRSKVSSTSALTETGEGVVGRTGTEAGIRSPGLRSVHGRSRPGLNSGVGAIYRATQYARNRPCWCHGWWHSPAVFENAAARLISSSEVSSPLLIDPSDIGLCLTGLQLACPFYCQVCCHVCCQRRVFNHRTPQMQWPWLTSHEACWPSAMLCAASLGAWECATCLR